MSPDQVTPQKLDTYATSGEANVISSARGEDATSSQQIEKQIMKSVKSILGKWVNDGYNNIQSIPLSNISPYYLCYEATVLARDEINAAISAEEEKALFVKIAEKNEKHIHDEFKAIINNTWNKKYAKSVEAVAEAMINKEAGVARSASYEIDYDNLTFRDAALYAAEEIGATKGYQGSMDYCAKEFAEDYAERKQEEGLE